MTRVIIRERSWIARIAATVLKTKRMAIVVGHTIYLHNTLRKDFLNNKAWLLHELKHVEQYERLGITRFIFLYLVESVRRGYVNNRFEVEARAAELNKTLPVNYNVE